MSLVTSQIHLLICNAFAKKWVFFQEGETALADKTKASIILTFSF